MLRYGSIQTVSTTTTTTEDSEDPLSERRIRRLRLTLPAGNNGNKETKTADTAEGEKDVSERWKKRNGLIRRERPAGRESPQQHLRDPTNGVPETSLRHHGPKVYGVVQRMGSDRQQELMAREWTASHLHDEMRYIREVRDSLEKVRERMYGQFGGLQQSMEKLSREIREANSHRMSLESEVKTRTAAMESFDQMNSSLISANLSLQKSLLENCQNRVDARDEVKSLRSTFEKTQEKLRDKERELAAAQAENQTLKLQVESTREANTWAMQALAEKLHMEHEEELLKQQQKHREEIENLQAQLDEYIRRLEEAERNIRIAEAKIAERDQRIVEVERLLDCMGKEKLQLQKKLQESEQRLSLLKLTDTTDAAAAKRSKELKRETEDLKERIKHLNDMVFCQQRKVKGMIEEVESLRAQVAQKDMFISELLDRIAIVECENNELEDKVKYFMSTQNRPRVLETREVGVGCDLLPSREAQSHDAEPVHLDSTHLPSPFEPPLSPPQPSSPISSSSPTQWSSSNDTSSLTPPPPPSFPTHHPSFNQTPPVQPPLSPPQPSSPISSSSPTQWSSSNDTSSLTPPPPPSFPTHHPSFNQTPPVQPPLSPPQPSSPISSSSPTQWSSSNDTSSPTSPRLSSHPSPYPSFSLTQPRTLRPTNPPPSRLESSLLKYTPVQYSRLLQSSSSAQNGLSSYSHLSEDQPVRSGTDEVDAGRQSTQRESTSLSSFSSQPKSGRRQVYTPFMKLMEMTAKINIE